SEGAGNRCLCCYQRRLFPPARVLADPSGEGRPGPEIQEANRSTLGRMADHSRDGERKVKAVAARIEAAGWRDRSTPKTSPSAFGKHIGRSRSFGYFHETDSGSTRAKIILGWEPKVEFEE